MDVLKLLDREVRDKVESIISEAERRASLILKDAERKRYEIVERYRPVAEEVYKGAYQAVLSKAMLKSKKLILEAQEEILKEAKRVALQEVEKVIEDRERYEEMLKSLVEEAIHYMKNNVEVRINPRDVDIMESILKDLPKEWVINPPKYVGSWDVDMNTWNVVPDESVWAGALFVDKTRNFILNSDLKVRLERVYNQMLERFREEVDVESI